MSSKGSKASTSFLAISLQLACARWLLLFFRENRLPSDFEHPPRVRIRIGSSFPGCRCSIACCLSTYSSLEIPATRNLRVTVWPTSASALRFAGSVHRIAFNFCEKSVSALDTAFENWVLKAG
jgi:hypothetical protein